MARRCRCCPCRTFFHALVLVTICNMGIASIASTQATRAATNSFSSTATTSGGLAPGSGSSRLVPSLNHAQRFAASPSSGESGKPLQAGGQYAASQPASAVQTTNQVSNVEIPAGQRRQGGHPPSSYSLGLSFLGVGNGFPGFTVSAPRPNANIAVGDTEVVQWVDTSYADFDKFTGAIIRLNGQDSTLGNTIWADLLPGSMCANNNDGSAIVQWDAAAHRWLMTQNVFVSPYAVCVAVSQTSTFSDNLWYAYQFPVLDNGWPDYPKWGVWSSGGASDGYFQTMNNLGPSGSGFVGAEMCGYDRAKMLVGDSTAEQICFQLDSADTSLLPADVDSPTQPPSAQDEFFIGGVGAVDNSHMSLYSMHINDWGTGNATFTGIGNSQLLAIDPFTPACDGNYSGNCVPQKGVSNLLQSLGDRLMYRFAYYSDNEVFDPIPVTQLSIFQQGTLAPDTNWRWMGSMAGDRANDILVGYSVSSSSLFPSIAVAGRTVNDPIGTLETELTVVSGAGSQTSSPWGGYSAMRVDPADNCTFWYTTEYYQSPAPTDWSTQVASFTFPSCGAPQILRQHWYVNFDVSAPGGQNGVRWMEVSSGLPSQTTVTSSVNPSNVNQSVTLTATVTGSDGTPTGTVTFTYNNGTSIPECPSPIPLNDIGAATCTTQSLPAGSDTIQANYSGDSTYLPSKGTLSQTVNKINSNTALLSSLPNGSNFNQAVTFTATVTASSPGGLSPTGTVTFTYNNGNSIPGCPSPILLNQSGVATCTTQSLPAGSDVVTASYSGDNNFIPSSGTFTQTVGKANTTLALTSMPNPSSYGQPVSITATVTGAFGGSPTGTVSFTDNGSPISGCTGIVLLAQPNGSVASCQTSTLTAGIHADIVATYGGDNNYNGNNSTLQPAQVVNQATPVFTNLTTTPSSITYGTASVTVSGTICVAGGACPPSGELVSITIDEALQKAAIGQNGAFSVSFPTATIPASTTPYPVTYSYGGDRNFHSAAGTGQPLTVNQANTTVALTSIPNPSSYGQPVTITATVTGAFGGSPSGTVNFTDNGVAIKGCSGITLNAGVATCQTSTLTVGTHANIVATYSGNNNYNGSNSTLQPAQVVNKAATTVVLTSAPNPSSYGQAVTITATVTGAFGGSPTGTVTFTDNDLPIAGCSGVVLVAQTNGSMATCQTSTLSVGTHAGITAPYSGDTNYNGSNSTLQPAQLVNKAATTIVLTSAPNPSIYGQPVTITATATGAFGGSPTGTINFTDNGVAIPGCSAVVLVAQTNGSVGACQTSTLSVGTHNQIKTQYGGDQNYLGGNSTLNPGQVVEGAPTTTTLTAHPNPANFGQPVTFTATVTTRGGAFASGSVTFQSNGVNIPDCPNPATLVNGVASCTTQSLSGGSDTILASFNDPQGFYGPSSATLTEQVGDFTVLPISPSRAIVVQSFSNIDEPFFAQAINVTVQPLMGYNNTVSLSCSVSPVLAGGSCVVNAPASGSLAGGNLSTTLTISAGSTTPIGSYTVTVTGQDNTGLVHSATLTLTVINYTATITMPSGGGGRTKVIFPGPAGTPITNLSCPQVSGTGIAGTEDLSLIGGVCTFTPTSVDLPAPVLITISGCTVARLRTHMPIFASFLFGIPGIVLLGSLHGGWRRRKRMLRMVAFLLVALSLLLGVGCGGYGQLSPTGNYSVLVQGTGPDGTVYSAVVPVTVTPLNQ